MRVDGAQFYRGQPPAAEDGPAMVSFTFSSTHVAPGMKSKPAGGNVTIDTTAIAVWLDGDVGYWIIEPGAIDPMVLNQLTFAVKLSFSPFLPNGKHTVSARAANAKGQFGPPLSAEIDASSVPGNSTLLISLEWDTQADLDLHVVTPSGAIIWAKNINSADPTTDPDWMAGGILDFDSNSNCVIDGLRREDAYWTEPPPTGHYVVRVDAYSLCGEIQADWTVTAQLDGMSLGEASGFARDRDTAYPHDANAGVTALEFDVN